MIYKIDIHSHVTNRPIKGIVDPSAWFDVIRDRMDKYGIDKTVLLASYFPHKGSGISNYRLLKWIDMYDPHRKRFLMFASLDAGNYLHMGLNEINELASGGLIHGIKVYTCYQDIKIMSLGFYSIMKLAHKYKLPVMFHTGVSYACRRKYGKNSPSTLYSAKDFSNLAAMYPDVNIILSHMSKPFFDEIVDVCRACPNVYTDMSGLLDSLYEENEIPTCVGEIKKFIDTVGAEKLLFGTDFPVQTHAHSVKFVEDATIGMADSVREAIYHGNATKVLKSHTGIGI